jgi:cytochrome c
MVRALGIAAAIVALSSNFAFAAGDATKGAAIFNRCAMCHSNTKGAPNRIGPNLFGVVGRKAGTVADFSYSSAVKASGIVWTPENLGKWVMGPGKFIPGNRMTFAGLSSQTQADDLVAYLETLK